MSADLASLDTAIAEAKKAFDALAVNIVHLAAAGRESELIQADAYLHGLKVARALVETPLKEES